MRDDYLGAVLLGVFMGGGIVDRVSRQRVEMCAAIDTPVEEAARLELQMQQDRDRLAREMARLTVVGGVNVDR